MSQKGGGEGPPPLYTSFGHQEYVQDILDIFFKLTLSLSWHGDNKDMANEYNVRTYSEIKNGKLQISLNTYIYIFLCHINRNIYV